MAVLPFDQSCDTLILWAFLFTWGWMSSEAPINQIWPGMTLSWQQSLDEFLLVSGVQKTCGSTIRSGQSCTPVGSWGFVNLLIAEVTDSDIASFLMNQFGMTRKLGDREQCDDDLCLRSTYTCWEEGICLLKPPVTSSGMTLAWLVRWLTVTLLLSSWITLIWRGK